MKRLVGASARSTLDRGVAPGLLADGAPPMLVIALVLGAALAAFWPSWVALGREWLDPESRYSHGFLLLLATLALVSRNLPKRVDLSRAGGPSPLAYVALAGTSLLWLIAHRAAIVAAEQFLALAAALICLYCVLGRRIGAVVAGPLALLTLALPLWDSAMDVFQRMTIAVVRVLATLVALPVSFEGPYVHLEAGTFEIAPSCNGLQLFLAACATGGLLAVRRRDGAKAAALVVLAAGIVGLVANWLRVFAVVLAGHLSDMQHYLVRSEHYTLGWSLFAIGMMLLVLLLDRRPEGRLPEQRPLAAPRSVARLAGVAACMAVGPAVALVGARAGADEPGVIALADWRISGWSGPEVAVPDWYPSLTGYTALGSGRFLPPGGDRSVTLYVARWEALANGRELAGQQSRLWPNGWREGALPGGALGAGPRDTTPLALHVVTDFIERPWLVAAQYRSGSRTYGSALRAQLDFAVTSLLGTAACGVAVAAVPCETDCRAESELLRAFIAAAEEPIAATIAAAADEPQESVGVTVSKAGEGSRQ